MPHRDGAAIHIHFRMIDVELVHHAQNHRREGLIQLMILGTVLDELERRNLSTALITLCVGAGMGTATIIERV